MVLNQVITDQSLTPKENIHQSQNHDDVIKWKHFPRYCAFCAWNSLVIGEFSAQRPVTRSSDVFFDLRLNRELTKQWRRRWFETPSLPLWRHCNVKPLNDKPRHCHHWHIYIYIYIVIMFLLYQHGIPKPCSIRTVISNDILRNEWNVITHRAIMSAVYMLAAEVKSWTSNYIPQKVMDDFSHLCSDLVHQHPSHNQSLLVNSTVWNEKKKNKSKAGRNWSWIYWMYR